MKRAIDEKEPVEVVIRNYRKDGELFFNHVTLTPLFDGSGKLIYYLGIQYDINRNREHKYPDSSFNKKPTRRLHIGRRLKVFP